MKLTKGIILRKILVLLVIGVLAAVGLGSAGAGVASASCTGVASSTVYAPSGSYNIYFNVQGQNCTSDVYDMQIAQCPGSLGIAAGWTDSTAGGFNAVCQQQSTRILNRGMSCDQSTGCHINNYTNVVSYTAQCWFWQATHWVLPKYQYRTRQTLANGTAGPWGTTKWAYGTGAYLSC